MFIAEGDLVVRRALEAGCKPDVVLCDPKCAHEFAESVHQAGGTTLTASADIRREVTGLGVPLDAIGVFLRPPISDAQELINISTRIIVLDCVDNPSNVGTIARSAAALGWNALLLDSTSADPLARRALRVSMGTTFKLPFARVSNVGETLQLLAARGFSIVGMTPHHPTKRWRACGRYGLQTINHERLCLVRSAKASAMQPSNTAMCWRVSKWPMASTRSMLRPLPQLRATRCVNYCPVFTRC